MNNRKCHHEYNDETRLYVKLNILTSLEDTLNMHCAVLTWLSIIHCCLLLSVMAKIKQKYLNVLSLPTSSTKFPETSLLSSCSSSVAACALFCKSESIQKHKNINSVLICYTVYDDEFKAYLSNIFIAKEKAERQKRSTMNTQVK